MKIASVTSTIRGETDAVLTDIAERLQAEGLSLAGIVKQQEYAPSFDNGCDMKVRVLPTGPVIKITQNLGGGSDACRLDPGAIANSVSSVEAGSLDGSDLFILNKFGPEEAAGRGFVSAIGKAIEQGIPVLVGVGKGNQDAFDTFAGGLADSLDANRDTVADWCRSALPKPGDG